MFTNRARQDRDGGAARRGLWRTMAIAAVTAAFVAPTAVWASHGFDDVSNSNTFHDDIDWLADAGVTKGCNPPANDEFCPGDFVTREQMAAFMHRLADNQVVDAGAVGGVAASQFLASAQGHLGYAAACKPMNSSYNPITECGRAYNSSGGSITITRNTTGVYRVTFEGLGAEGPGGHAQVTPYGATTDICKLDGDWGESTGDATIDVFCLDDGGNLTAASFTVLWIS